MVKNPHSQAEKQTLLLRWYKSQLHIILQHIFEKYTVLTGLTPKEYTIRKMRTQWGSCNICRKKISLNIELIKKKKECIEYVVLHELIHLVEKTHNENFQKLMTKYMYNWRTIRTEMQQSIITA